MDSKNKEMTLESPKNSVIPTTSKMRIKLFDPIEKILISDRLVEQSTELLKGPKEEHKGPMSFEVNLYQQEDVDGFIAYLKKIKGELPLEKEENPKVKKDKKLDKMLSDKEPLLDLLKVFQNKGTSQEKLIALAREYDFRFIASDVAMDHNVHNPGQIEIRDNHKDYQFMVRLIKEAKDPANDKYDWRLVFGIKIVGEKTNHVKVYLFGKFDTSWKIPWEDAKEHNFKKVEKVYIFPEYMDIDDRKKWRSENRKVIRAQETGEAYEPSKFYNKYSPYIKVH